jgi:hypothetical protein
VKPKSSFKLHGFIKRVKAASAKRKRRVFFRKRPNQGSQARALLLLGKRGKTNLKREEDIGGTQNSSFVFKSINGGQQRPLVGAFFMKSPNLAPSISAGIKKISYSKKKKNAADKMSCFIRFS